MHVSVLGFAFLHFYLCSYDSVCFCILKIFMKKFNFCYFKLIFFNVLDYFDMLILKIIFLKYKKILF